MSSFVKVLLSSTKNIINVDKKINKKSKSLLRAVYCV
jgi:hypothetical protein